MKSIKAWYIVLAVILLIGIIGSVVALTHSKQTVVVIEQDKKIIEKIDLSDYSEAKEIEISCADGTNTILIENGQIRIIDADCPDQTCVKMGVLRSSALPIVCLPHHLVIRFADNSEGQLDGEVY